MELNEFIVKFRAIFEDGQDLKLNHDTVFSDLNQWDSLAVLGFMSMIDNEYDSQITSADLIKAKTILDLFEVVKKNRQ